MLRKNKLFRINGKCFVNYSMNNPNCKIYVEVGDKRFFLLLTENIIVTKRKNQTVYGINIKLIINTNKKESESQ